MVSPSGALGSVSAVRALPHGRMIVHDLSRRRVLMLNASLQVVRVIADTTAATGALYGSRLCGFLPFYGDSSLFIDPASLSMSVMDARGEVVRTMAVPSVEDVSTLVGGPFGTPAVDPTGHLVFRGYGRTANAREEPDPSKPVPSPAELDSAPLYRLALATRERKEIGAVAVPRHVVSRTKDATGQVTGSVLHVTPLLAVDDWALMPDGRVAIVRGSDYHVDWLLPDGSAVSSPKIPHAWQRLDDAQKQSLVDSTRAVFDQARQAILTSIQSTGSDIGAAMAVASSSPLGAGVTMVLRRPDAVSGAPRMEVSVPTVFVVGASQLPDYRPAFLMGAARADLSGNLWVRTTARSDAGAIYDVIGANGTLKDRVKVPFGRVVVGFGPDAVVYLGVLDEAGARLEVARIR